MSLDSTETATIETDDFIVTSNSASEAQLRETHGSPAAAEKAIVEEPAAEPVEAATEPDPASEAGKELAKKRGSLQSRINELTREKHDSKREADAARAEVAALRHRLEALERGTQPAPKASQTAETYSGTPKPKVEDFETWDEFNESLLDWKVAELSAKQRMEQAQESRVRSDQSVLAAAQARIDAFKAEHADYDDVVNAAYLPPGPTSDVIVTHLRHVEAGPALAYELGSNPAELARIVSLPPALAVAALGKLEGQIESRTAAAQSGPAVEPNITKAKPLIKPVSGSPVASDDGEVPDDLSVDEHIRRMNAKDRTARRR